MTIETLRESLPEYAKDIKLNVSSVLSATQGSSLNAKQILATALASAYATKNKTLINHLEQEVEGKLEEVDITAAKGAATIMGMNNIYYRFLGLVKDDEYQKLPANLRMNFLLKPGVDKVDFEIYALAVSAVEGCAGCVKAHVGELEKHGISKTTIQHSIRIASVINALNQVLVIEKK
ncbi:MAG: carboxymuconolactone decarboxylase family protein [Alphaproteobacteria bacterium]|jgi:alkyl hydroperoxide reductase subunit D